MIERGRVGKHIPCRPLSQGLQIDATDDSEEDEGQDAQPVVAVGWESFPGQAMRIFFRRILCLKPVTEESNWTTKTVCRENTTNTFIKTHIPSAWPWCGKFLQSVPFLGVPKWN